MLNRSQLVFIFSVVLAFVSACGDQINFSKSDLDGDAWYGECRPSTTGTSASSREVYRFDEHFFQRRIELYTGSAQCEIGGTLAGRVDIEGSYDILDAINGVAVNNIDDFDNDFDNDDQKIHRYYISSVTASSFNGQGAILNAAFGCGINWIENQSVSVTFGNFCAGYWLPGLDQFGQSTTIEQEIVTFTRGDVLTIQRSGNNAFAGGFNSGGCFNNNNGFGGFGGGYYGGFGGGYYGGAGYPYYGGGFGNGNSTTCAGQIRTFRRDRNAFNDIFND